MVPQDRLHISDLSEDRALASDIFLGNYAIPIQAVDFSVASPRTLPIHGGCHKDIMDGTNVFTDEKYDP